MSDKNDVVIINLDRPRELRYGHKALKMLLAMTGKDIDAIDMDNLDLEQLEKYLYCGLLSDAKANGEVLKLEEMEDLLDQANFGELILKMNKAMQKAMSAVQEAVPTQNDPNGSTLPKQKRAHKK